MQDLLLPGSCGAPPSRRVYEFLLTNLETPVLQGLSRKPHYTGTVDWIIGCRWLNATSSCCPLPGDGLEGFKPLITTFIPCGHNLQYVTAKGLVINFEQTWSVYLRKAYISEWSRCCLLHSRSSNFRPLGDMQIQSGFTAFYEFNLFLAR